MRRFSLPWFVFTFFLLAMTYVKTDQPTGNKASPIALSILSSKTLSSIAGEYALVVVALMASDEAPQVSNITHFSIQPKRNLNPGQALGSSWHDGFTCHAYASFGVSKIKSKVGIMGKRRSLRFFLLPRASAYLRQSVSQSAA